MHPSTHLDTPGACLHTQSVLLPIALDQKGAAIGRRAWSFKEFRRFTTSMCEVGAPPVVRVFFA